MKQHITAEQLNELTEAQKERLREWWCPAEGDIFCNLEADPDETMVVTIEWMQLISPIVQKWEKVDMTELKLLPCLSIGQCIELLDEIDPKKLCHVMQYLFSPLYFYVEEEAGEMKYLEPVEVIDALWQAVKECL